MCNSSQVLLCPIPMEIHQGMLFRVITFQKLNQNVSDPQMTFYPTSAEVICATLPEDHCNKYPWKHINLWDTMTIFQKF